MTSELSFCYKSGGSLSRRGSYLDEGANDTERGETEVFERPSFACRIQERVKK